MVIVSGIGSIEAAILTYVGEISEPRLRGTLTSFAEIAEYIGFVFMFLLGTLTDWRTSALISTAVPVLTVALLTQVQLYIYRTYYAASKRFLPNFRICYPLHIAVF